MKKPLLVLLALVVCGAIAAGFYYIGPPAEARARRLDERRVSDLQRLRLAIDLFWTRNGRLPPTLDDLAKEAGTSIYSRDPQTAEAYGYAVTGSGAYELCGTFARSSEGAGDFWSHPEGRHCYAVNARRIKP